jgi:flagella basal body P-ring formation protein FlgA
MKIKMSINKFISAMAVCLMYAVFSFVFASDGISIEFRDKNIVNDTAIYLGDIASVSGVSAEKSEILKSIRVGHSAPPGFSRLMNIREMTAYSLSRHLNGIKCEISGPDRIEIKTDCLEIRHDKIKSKLISCLKNVVMWPESSYSVQVSDTNMSVCCFNRPYTIEFDHYEDVYPRGNVIMKFRIIQDNYSVSSGVVCHINVTLPVLVAKREIKRGESLNPDCFEMSERNITVFRYNPILCNEGLQNRIASRTIPPGTIIHQNLTSVKPVINKGDMISVITRCGAVMVSLQVRAREDGAIGDRIFVENPDTHQIFQVRIQNQGIAAIVSREAT